MTDKKDRTDAADLGLDLPGGTAAGDDATLFRWLVACLLFGARISQERAAAAFHRLDDDGVLTPEKLASASERHLVELLDAARYTRYDDSKAAELTQLGRDVLEHHDGRLSSLPEGARSKKEVAQRLQRFKGIGPVAADIFLARRTGRLAPLSTPQDPCPGAGPAGRRQPTNTASARAPSGAGR